MDPRLCASELLFGQASLHFLQAPATAWILTAPWSQYVRSAGERSRAFRKRSYLRDTQNWSTVTFGIATDAGLIRFDGLHFRLIQDSARPSESKSALGLAAGSDGSLVDSVRDLTLRRYLNGKFDNPFRPGTVSNITAIGRTNQGALLAARMQLGAFTLS